MLCRSVKPLPRYRNSYIVRMPAAAILDFFRPKICNGQTVTRAELRHHMPNFVNIAETVVKIWRVFDFSRWRLRHLGFLKFQIFNSQEDWTASSCQISSKSVIPRLRYGYFQIFQDGGRRHLGFSKFSIFNNSNGQGVELHQLAKFSENRLNRGRNMAIFRFLQMAATAILDFWNFKF